MHEEILKKAEVTHDELLAAYATHNEERERFHALLGAEAKGAEAVGLLRKYGPQALKLFAAGGTGAGGLAVLGNIFPSLSKVLGLGG